MTNIFQMIYSWTLCSFYQNVSVETKYKIVYEMITKLTSIIHNVRSKIYQNYLEKFYLRDLGNKNQMRIFIEIGV